MLVMSGGEGYIDFRIGNIVFQLLIVTTISGVKRIGDWRAGR